VRRLFDAAHRLRDHEDLLVICLATVLVMAGQGIITPNLALYARSLA
jgi:hypothetical protein